LLRKHLRPVALQGSRRPSSAVVPAVLQVAALFSSGGAIELANSRVDISVRSA
jgi:hypothetical protein